MQLSELLSPDRVRIPLGSTAKPDILRELVSLIPNQDEAAREELLQAVLDREQRMSTGIGRGVAIPHGKSDRVEGMEIALGISSEPIDYGSLDGEPVEVFFLLLSPPEQTTPHIKTLARISRLLCADNVCASLTAVNSAQEALDLLRREEAQLGD